MKIKYLLDVNWLMCGLIRFVGTPRADENGIGFRIGKTFYLDGPCAQDMEG